MAACEQCHNAGTWRKPKLVPISRADGWMGDSPVAMVDAAVETVPCPKCHGLHQGARDRVKVISAIARWEVPRSAEEHSYRERAAVETFSRMAAEAIEKSGALNVETIKIDDNGMPRMSCRVELAVVAPAFGSNTFSDQLKDARHEGRLGGVDEFYSALREDIRFWRDDAAVAAFMKIAGRVADRIKRADLPKSGS